MSLLGLCEPIFQYVCRLNRSAQKGCTLQIDKVRSEIKQILEQVKSTAAAKPEAASQYEKVELPLVFFIDFMAKQKRLGFGAEWVELASERQELAGDDAAAHESASVNALYSFPKSLAQLAPRMARYLDLIFGTAGEWGAKPVFFRGIYFTSSMQEGAALDEDLAQALGISVESLPEGPAWTRDRAYFLRDLFVKKVFQEKGLVSTAVNASKQYVRRRMVFWLSVAVAVLFLLIYTIHAEHRFGRTVAPVKSYVSKAAEAKKDNSLDMVEFTGMPDILWGKEEDVADQKVLRYEFPSKFKAMIDTWEGEKGGTWFLLPLTSLFNVDAAAMREALKSVFEDSVLRPFYEETCELMASPSGAENWTIRSSELRVLAQLIKLRSGRTPLPLAPAGRTDEYDANSFFDPFCEYWCNRQGITGTPGMPATLNAVLRDLLVSNPDLLNSLSQDRTLNPQVEKGIAAAVARFVKHWDPNMLMAGDSDINDLNNLIVALRDLDGKEKALLELKTADLGQIQAQWTGRFNELKVAYDAVEKYVATQKGSLQSRYNDWITRMGADANASCDKLLIALQEGLKAPLADWRSKVEGVKKRWQDAPHAIGTIASDITALDPNFWAEVKGQRLYQIRFQMYNATNGKVNYKPDTNVSVHPEPGKKRVKDALDKVDKNFDPNSQTVSNNFKLKPNAHRFEDANSTCTRVLTLTKQGSKKQIVLAALSTVPKVKELEPKIGSNTETAIDYLNDWAALKSYVDPDAYNRKSEEVYKKYVREYWLGTYLKDRITEMIPKKEVWPDQYDAVYPLLYSDIVNKRGVREQLAALGDSVDEIAGIIFEQNPNDPNVLNFRDNLNILTAARSDTDYYENVLDRWKTLTRDAATARDKVLKQERDDFLGNYFPRKGIVRQPPPERFVDLYWWRFSLETLRALSVSPSGLPDEAKELLKRATYYPISDNLNAPDLPMNWSQFVQLKKNWHDVNDVSRSENDTNTMRTQNTAIRPINDLLPSLRDVKRSSPEWEPFRRACRRIDLVFDANSKAERGYLQLSLPVTGNEVIDGKLHYVKVEGKTATSNGQQKITGDRPEVLLATIPWPETRITLSFYIAQSDPPVSYGLYDSQWTFVRILDDARMIDGVLKKSTIKKPVLYERQNYPFTLAVQWVSEAPTSDTLRH